MGAAPWAWHSRVALAGVVVVRRVGVARTEKVGSAGTDCACAAGGMRMRMRTKKYGRRHGADDGRKDVEI